MSSGPTDRAAPIRQSTSCPTTRTKAKIWSGKPKPYGREPTSRPRRWRRPSAKRRNWPEIIRGTVSRGGGRHRERHQASELRTRGCRGMHMGGLTAWPAAYATSHSAQKWLWISCPSVRYGPKVPSTGRLSGERPRGCVRGFPKDRLPASNPADGTGSVATRGRIGNQRATAARTMVLRARVGGRSAPARARRQASRSL